MVCIKPKGAPTSRIAVLSDIHANLHALESALAFIDRAHVDDVFCLGDIVGYGANPNECVALVRKHCRATVKGNHDLAATDLVHANYFTAPGKTAAIWTNKTLTQDNFDYLASLPMIQTTAGITLVHSSPDAPHEWHYVLSLETAALQFRHFTTEVCFIGHTHIPIVCGENLKTFMLKKGMKFIINTGSVGQPRDGNPQLSFGIFDDGEWKYENVRAEYDIPGAAAAIVNAGLPQVLATRLSHGF